MLRLTPSLRTCTSRYNLSCRHLSLFTFQHSRRLYATTHDATPISLSSTSPSSAPPTTSHSPPPPPPPPPRPKSKLRPVIFAISFLAVGLLTGQFIRFAILPPPLPIPNTADDIALLSHLQSQLSSLPLIQHLRSARHPSDASAPLYHEWPAYSSFPSASYRRFERLTTGPLSGSRGLAIQQCFHNPLTNEITVVIFFGGALCGWPGIVHGGAIATVMDECLGRMAVRCLDARTGVTANLKVEFRKPVLAGRWYVFRGWETESGAGKSGKGNKAVVEGVLESLESLESGGGEKGGGKGKVCVGGRAVYVVPKGMEALPIPEDF